VKCASVLAAVELKGMQRRRRAVATMVVGLVLPEDRQAGAMDQGKETDSGGRQ